MSTAPEAGAAGEELVRELLRRGHDAAEVYEKRGRSRTFERAADRETTQSANEAGWAARAGDSRRSFFVAATGAPDPRLGPPLLPDASPHPLLLPDPTTFAGAGERGAKARTAPRPVTMAPHATESEAATLFDAVERRLADELPEARLDFARLDDGGSEGALVSSRGLAVRHRTRAAWLRLEASANGRRVALTAAERAPGELRPDALARRLVDRLAALGGAASVAAETESPRAFVLAAPLASRLVEALAPLFVGRGAESRLAPLLAADRRIAGDAVTLVDDGGFAGGVLATPTDGEGVPSRRVALVERGLFRTPLLAWWESKGEFSGCMRRASYRDLPRRAPTQLYLEPGDSAPAALLEGLADAAYLIDAEGAVRLDRTRLSFSVPVSGFRLVRGAAPSPLGPVRLEGTVAALLGSVRAVARDLAFVPGDGLFGAPTLRVEGADESELTLRAVDDGPPRRVRTRVR